MRTVSEKYANILKYDMDDSNSFLTKKITMPIGSRLCLDCSIVSIINKRLRKHSAKNGLTLHDFELTTTCDAPPPPTPPSPTGRRVV